MSLTTTQLKRTTRIAKLETAPLAALFKALSCGTNGYDLNVKEHREWAVKDAEEVYRKIMLRVHPDKGGNPEDAIYFSKVMRRIRNVIFRKRRVIVLPAPRTQKYNHVCKNPACKKTFKDRSKDKLACSPECRQAVMETKDTLHNRILSSCRNGALTREELFIRSRPGGPASFISELQKCLVRGELMFLPGRYVTR